MRQGLALILALVAGTAAVAAACAWYVRDNVVARDAFTDRAVVALDRAPVRDAINAEITQQVLARVPSGAASPQQIRALVDRATATRRFRRAYRRGAREIHAALFSGRRGRSATLDVDVAGLLTDVAPQLAPVLGGDTAAQLVTVHTSSLPIDSRRISDAAGTAAVGLAVLAALALAAALLVAARRATVLAVAGGEVLVCGVLLLILLGVGRAAVLDAADAAAGISRDQARAAAGGVWDVYADGLHTIAIVAIIAGAVVALLALILGSGRRRT